MSESYSNLIVQLMQRGPLLRDAPGEVWTGTRRGYGMRFRLPLPPDAPPSAAVRSAVEPRLDHRGTRAACRRLR